MVCLALCRISQPVSTRCVLRFEQHAHKAEDGSREDESGKESLATFLDDEESDKGNWCNTMQCDEGQVQGWPTGFYACWCLTWYWHGTGLEAASIVMIEWMGTAPGFDHVVPVIDEHSGSPSISGVTHRSLHRSEQLCLRDEGGLPDTSASTEYSVHT